MTAVLDVPREGVLVGCSVCGRPMRPYDAKAADWPGTVSRRSATACYSCFKRPAGAPVRFRGETKLQVEDVEWMAETGEIPERAATRAGYAKWDSLRLALIKAGRDDLVQRLLSNHHGRNPE
ncbi:hypothetical protein [Sinomonas soli]